MVRVDGSTAGKVLRAASLSNTTGLGLADLFDFNHEVFRSGRPRVHGGGAANGTTAGSAGVPVGASGGVGVAGAGGPPTTTATAGKLDWNLLFVRTNGIEMKAVFSDKAAASTRGGAGGAGGGGGRGRAGDEDVPLTTLDGLFAAKPTGLYALKHVQAEVDKWRRQVAGMRGEGDASTKEKLQRQIAVVQGLLEDTVAVDPGECGVRCWGGMHSYWWQRCTSRVALSQAIATYWPRTTSGCCPSACGRASLAGVLCGSSFTATLQRPRPRGT